MKFYANLYPVTIFYTNLPKTMLSLKFYAFISMVSRRPVPAKSSWNSHTIVLIPTPAASP